MANLQGFLPGDFLIFQIESGFSLLRLLAVDGEGDETVWHLRSYSDLYMDIEFAEAAALGPNTLGVAIPHVALTDRAFSSTQVAKLGNRPLDGTEAEALNEWRNSSSREVSDRSIRLMLGLR